MLTTDPQARDVTAEVYEMTEEARLILGTADPELSETTRSVGEAAYYLSDTLDPEERTLLLRRAEAQARNALRPDAGADAPADALALLCDARGEVEQILRGRHASSELRIALRALRRAIGDLADRLGVATKPLDPIKLPGQWLEAFRRDRS